MYIYMYIYLHTFISLSLYIHIYRSPADKYILHPWHCFPPSPGVKFTYIPPQAPKTIKMYAEMFRLCDNLIFLKNIRNKLHIFYRRRLPNPNVHTNAPFYEFWIAVPPPRTTLGSAFLVGMREPCIVIYICCIEVYEWFPFVTGTIFHNYVASRIW